MVFDRVLPATGHHDDVVGPCGDRLLDAVLNDRFVDERQHFLGLCLGGGKKSGAESGYREDSFANRCRHVRMVAEDSAAQRIYNCWAPCLIPPLFANMSKTSVGGSPVAASMSPSRSKTSPRSKPRGAVSFPSS